jgi:hypothetical protein
VKTAGQSVKPAGRPRVLGSRIEVQAGLPIEQVAALRRVAERLGVSQSEVVRRAVGQFVELVEAGEETADQR